MNKRAGITLIALVITIIVLLILAGVSINLLTGENGIIEKAVYASFVNEMTAVEENLKMWQSGESINGDYTKPQTKIPTNGLYSVSELEKTERLTGEVGYFRVWSLSDNKPDVEISSSDTNFNSAFESELIYYPAGVQDLYYLNNEQLGISGNKKYLIDASNGMVYSTSGIKINGIQCYSLSMAKIAMGGYSDTPIFAEAEVSGAGNGEILAGNVSNKYKVDEDGNYILDENGNKIENPDYNQYGFQIIASPSSHNVYKLYNNGDLYGKGIKNYEINENEDKIQSLDTNGLVKFNVPEEIPGASTNEVTIFPGFLTMYIIDKNGYLWAWGDNASNKLGLNENEQLEYTGKVPTKLNIDGKKVKKVFSSTDTLEGGNTFVITDSNELYGAGNNLYGQLGIGNTNGVDKFVKINVPNPEKIKEIHCASYSRYTVIEYDDNTFYWSGSNEWGQMGVGNCSGYNVFTQIWNGYVTDSNGNKSSYNVKFDIDQDIKELSIGTSIMILKKDGTIMQAGYRGNNCTIGCGAASLTGPNNEFCAFPEEFGTNVEAIYRLMDSRIIVRNNGGNKEYWGCPGSSGNLGIIIPQDGKDTDFYKIPIPNELLNDGIKEIYTSIKNVYYISNSGNLWISGEKYPGDSDYSTRNTIDKYNGIEKINTKVKISTALNIENVVVNQELSNTTQTAIFLGNDGNYYINGGSSAIINGDSGLQKSWKLIAQNVKLFACDSSVASAYVTEDNKIFLAGNDSRTLGLNISNQNNVEKVNNYTEYTGTAFNGKKITDIKIAAGITMIKTSDGNLYSTGLWNDPISNYPYYPGWEEEENKYDFNLIEEDVIDFDIFSNNRAVLTKNGILFWGRNHSGLSYRHIPIRLPEKFEYKNAKINMSKGDVDGYLTIIDGNGILYVCNFGGYYANLGMSANNLIVLKHTFEFNDEKVIDVVTISNKTAIALTDKGNVYGWGIDNRLGKNSSLNTLNTVPLKLKVDNVAQIIGGDDCFIAIKSNGEVWGTGSNINGILGRWIGIDRTQPNSRYKTALNWVECPELEI